MATTPTDAWIKRSLDLVFGTWTLPYLCLFQNNHTPNAATDVPSDYTAATFPGYAAVLFPSSYSGPVSDGSGGWIVSWASVAFTATGSSPSNTIYGYYVLDTVHTEVLWAQLLPGGPFTVNAAGLGVTVTPKYDRLHQ